MVMSIDNALITEFSDMVHHDAQQLQSRLKSKVVTKKMSGDLWAYDGLGSVEAREVVGRVVPATFDDIDHKRRKISRRRFVVNLPVDASDVRGALLSPDSEYSKAVAAAMVRQYDKVIAEAAFADVQTGRDFGTTVTAATDGVDTIDATAGLTYDELLGIMQEFIDDEVGNDVNEMLYGTLTGKENTQLMGEQELTSGDFTRQLKSDAGKVFQGAGFDFVHFGANVPSPILNVTSGVRDLIFASTRGICLGVSKDITITVKERDDYIETTQVQAIMDIGAVRTEGKLVKKVQVTA